MSDGLILRVNDALELRQLTLEDAEELAGLEEGREHRPQVEEAWYYPQSVDGARQFIQAAWTQYQQQQGVLFGIRFQGRLAGVVQLTRKPYGRTAGIDYALAPAFRGRGLVTMACAALIRFAFEEWDLHRLEIWVDVVNVKSCAVPERLGFVKEGVLRELACYGDFYGDAAIYALLRNDWPTEP